VTKSTNVFARKNENKCQCVDSFSKNILTEEGFANWQARANELMDASIEILNKNRNKIPSNNFLDIVPFITHHTYFTSLVRPSSISSKDLNIISANFTKLKASNPDLKWKHYFWTNNKDSIPREILELDGVEVRLVQDFHQDILYPQLLDFLKSAENKKRFFSMASDLVRLLVVEKYGGIYMDLDYEIYDAKSLMSFVRNSHFLSGVVSNTPFPRANSSFFSAKPHHDIIKTAKSLLIRNYLKGDDVPEYVKNPCSGFTEAINYGPITFTIAIYKAADITTDIYFPNRIIYKNNSEAPANKIISKIYNNHFYESKLLGSDHFSGSWISPEDNRNKCR
jgi:hypothetical protein